MDYNKISQSVEQRADKLCALSDKIWDYAETAFVEFKSVDALCAMLEEEGFEVTRGVGDVETAFSGRFGHGKPVIGLLGEYDALFGINQKADSFVKEPASAEEAGKPGHGCGHNLLGVGALAAAIAVKDYLQETGAEGTVVFYGTPGEEGGSGKAFMAREGVFDELDAAVTWHPASMNMVRTQGSLANIQALFKFTGVSSHAGGSPEKGRSALDAVELMNVGVNFVREHMPLSNRVHYAITNAGGLSPNVVQPYAEVLYLCRAPENEGAKELYDWVCDCARGAALMTQTSVEIDFVKACSNIIPNEAIERSLARSMENTQLPEYTDEERAYAKEMSATCGAGASAMLKKLTQSNDPKRREIGEKYMNEALYDFVMPYKPGFTNGTGSTDVGDVSWVCPTAQTRGMTCVAGTPGHSWQFVAQGKSSISHKGMLFNGKVMAATVIELMTDKELLAEAKEEHKRRVGDGYKCPIPKGVKPRATSDKM